MKGLRAILVLAAALVLPSGASAREKAKQKKAETKFFSCAEEKAPELFLSGGFILAVSSSLAPVFGAGYGGWQMWRCLSAESEAEESERLEASLKESETRLKAEILAEMKEIVARVSTRLEGRQKTDPAATAVSEAKLRAAAERYMSLIQKLGAKTVKEVYEELARIRGLEYEVVESHEDAPSLDGIPPPPTRVDETKDTLDKEP